MHEEIAGCRACGAGGLAEILAFGDMPLSDGLLTADQLTGRELRFPLTLLFCPSCSLVQIRETVAPDVLFGASYPYFSSFSDAWLCHCLENVTALIGERQLGPSSLVVEIASNDGYLLRNYVERGIRVLGIDPAPGPATAARQVGVTTREGFFGRALAESLAADGVRADVIHANNVLAHVADLHGVLDGMRLLLKENGVAVVEVPYVGDLITHCEFDTIYHEHLCYFSVTALFRLLAARSLVLTDVRRLPTHGGSLRLYVQRTGTPSAAVRTLLDEERQRGLDRVEYYLDFATRVRDAQRSLRHLLESLKAKGRRIAGYAAAAKGAILLNSAGIDGQLIDYVVDRNRHKQGKYLPGVHLPIFDTSKLLEEPPPDYVVILAWNFTDEIIRQQDAYRSRGGSFIVPIPQPAIIAGHAVRRAAAHA